MDNFRKGDQGIYDKEQCSCNQYEWIAGKVSRQRSVFIFDEEQTYEERRYVLQSPIYTEDPQMMLDKTYIQLRNGKDYN